MPPKRRSAGLGSVYQTPQGWMAALITYDAAGKRKRLYGRAKSRQEAAKKLTAMQARISEGKPARDASVKLKDYLPRWLDAAGPRLRPRTRDLYRWAIRKLSARLGDVKLSALTAPQVRRAYTALQADGMAASSIQVIHAALHQALEEARRGKLLGENITRDVSPPRIERREPTTLSAEDLGRVLRHAEDAGDPLCALWTLLPATGLRISEALGLRWADVDLTARRLRVMFQLGKDGGLVEPKTRQSRRPVDLTDAAAAALKAHRTRQEELRRACPFRWPQSDLVFRNAAGGPYTTGGVRQRWYRLLAAAGVPRVGLHATRHTFATLMLAAGEAPKVVAEALGHSSIAITQDIYSHVLPGMHRGAIDRLGETLSAARARVDADTEADSGQLGA